MKRSILNCRSKGFTLIELLVVVVIILILAAILFPVFTKARDNARRAACISNVKQIGVAIGLYKEDFDNCYPAYKYEYYNIVKADWGLGYWMHMIDPYVKSQHIFYCPSAYRDRSAMEDPANKISYGSYGINEYMVHIWPDVHIMIWPYPEHQHGYYGNKIAYPVETALVADCNLNLMFNDLGFDASKPEQEHAMNPAYGDGIQLPGGIMRIKYANGYKNGKLYSRHDGSVILYCDLHAQFMPWNRFDSIPKADATGNYIEPYKSDPSLRRQRPIIHPLAKPIP